MTFTETFRRCQEAAEKAGDGPFVLWPLTDEALAMWRANRGNAKARRRWRRRGKPNTQRAEAIALLHRRIDVLAVFEAQR